MRKLTVLLMLMFVTAVTSAQNVIINPQGIVVNPEPSFNVDVRLDRGGSVPSYQIGENITISVTVNADAWIYLFNVRSDGEVVQILPNDLDAEGRNNWLQAGQTKSFPPPNAGYRFEIDGPAGLDKVIAVASREQLNTRTLVNFTEGEYMFSSNIGESGFASALSIIVSPLPRNNWVTDTAHFWVGSPPAQPTTGTVTIESTPANAAVYVDGNYIGRSPVSYTARGGTYNVRVEANGYQTWSQSVTIRNGQHNGIHANLNAVRQTGTVSFHSAPQGARVYVNGDYIGTTPLNNRTYDTGTYTARFERDGYNSASVTFTVSADSRQTVNGSLQAQSGNLRIRANVGGAQVYLDGVHQGTIPSGSGVLDLTGLSEGTYELVVVAPGFNTYTGTVRINAGSTAEVRVQQTRR